MNQRSDIDRVLQVWMEDGPATIPDRVVDVVAARIVVQRQRRSWPFARRSTMSSLKLAAALAAAIVVAVVGYNLLPRQPSIGNPSVPPPSAVPSPTQGPAEAADPLAGFWKSAPSTCADQNAALQRAGYTAAQLALGGWDAATCMAMTHGATHRISFLDKATAAAPGGVVVDGRLVQYADGLVGWDGYYVLLDGGTSFVAGDDGRTPYLTYQYTITGDQLVIDMVKNEFPAPTAADLWDDTIAQTVIYESLPFTREP